MAFPRSRKVSLPRLGFHACVFAGIYLAVFFTLLWAGARTFPAPDPIWQEGLDLYLDRVATVIVHSAFTPFHVLGYEFLKFFGSTLWFAAAAFWSALLFIPYLAISSSQRSRQASEIKIGLPREKRVTPLPTR